MEDEGAKQQEPKNKSQHLQTNAKNSFTEKQEAQSADSQYKPDNDPLCQTQGNRDIRKRTEKRYDTRHIRSLEEGATQTEIAEMPIAE